MTTSQETVKPKSKRGGWRGGGRPKLAKSGANLWIHGDILPLVLKIINAYKLKKDARLAETILNAIEKGKEKVISWEDLEKELNALEH